ncbi:N-acetylmuramoyl-L-alanine amidase [Paenibacillus sp. GCM10027628]
MLSAEDANKIIAFLSAAYNATQDPEARAEFHRLANELRKASGQPEE